MTRTALIIGATGGIGGEMTRALLARGWACRAVNRKPEEAARDHAGLGPVEWVQGDAMQASDIIAAAQGVSLIVHAANPPGYRNWKGTAVPMLESSIAAAKSTGALIAFPGTVYNYGPETFPLVDELAPQKPRTRKGKIRVEMEDRLRQASVEGVRVLIVRAGDFFGPHSGKNSWFGQGLVKPGRPLRSIAYPGSRSVGHAWAFLPDLAETFMQLIDRQANLEPFALFHFGGHWFERGEDIARATAAAAGKPAMRIKGFPWAVIYLAAPFVETFREMIEMRYLWKKPLELNNRKLVAFLGHEPHTPTEAALRATLIGLGCLKPKSTNKLAPLSIANRSAS